MKKFYEVHVSAQLWVHGDTTVLAESPEEAEAKVREQLNLRGSPITSQLSQSASQQIRKEMDEEAFAVEILDSYEATAEDLEGEDEDE